MTGGIVTIGESLGLLRPSDGPGFEQASTASVGIGGAESNVAIAASRLGHAAAWIGRVGADSFGRRVVRELRAEGLSVHAIVDPTASTAVMLKDSVGGLRTRVQYFRTASAGSALTPEDIDPELIASARLLHVTGITCALSDSAEASIHTAVDLAVEAGVPVSFDVNHRRTLWTGRDATASYRRIAERADIIFGGPEEAELLVGPGSPDEQASRLTELGATQAVVKLGEAGAVARIDGDQHATAAIAVRVVDTVGAGDAFVAGYLTALLEGASPAERLERAVRCGAFACLGPGDWESYPRLEDLQLLDASDDPVAR